MRGIIPAGQLSPGPNSLFRQIRTRIERIHPLIRRGLFRQSGIAILRVSGQPFHHRLFHGKHGADLMGDGIVLLVVLLGHRQKKGRLENRIDGTTGGWLAEISNLILDLGRMGLFDQRGERTPAFEEGRHIADIALVQRCPGFELINRTFQFIGLERLGMAQFKHAFLRPGPHVGRHHPGARAVNRDRAQRGGEFDDVALLDIRKGHVANHDSTFFLSDAAILPSLTTAPISLNFFRRASANSQLPASRASAL